MKNFILGMVIMALIAMAYGAFNEVKPFSDWKNWVATEINSNTNTSAPSKPQIPTWTHTGYVKATLVNGNNTSIMFQDGFSVLLVGALRDSLLPSPGGKFKIIYGYDAQLGGNTLISLNPVK